MLQMSTHIAAASMLPAMLPNVAPQPLPGLPILQTPHIGNVGRVLPPSPVHPPLPVPKAPEVSDAKDSPFSTFARLVLIQKWFLKQRNSFLIQTF